MSLSIQVRPWAEDMVKSSVGLMKVCDSAGSDEEGLHLKLDRCDGSDSGCQIEDDLSPLGLMDSLTYNRGSSVINISEEEGRIVADVMEHILGTVEERVGSAYQREVVELESRSREEIDCDRSRERGKSRHRKADNPKKAVRRKRERSDDKKKSRRRSTSCSTTSSACSADYPRKHRRKHKHHRRSHDGHSPRVNPIFLWVKQDDTRIVEVLCEDYDKRNRIRLTKTAQGWRAIPRTERLASALSNRSSLDISNSDQPTPALVNPEETTSDKTYADTKDEEIKSENETICVLDHNENCDIDLNSKEMESKPFNVESECKNESNNVDSINMDSKLENRLESENSNIAMEECDDKCHEDLIEEIEEDDNKTVEDIEDIYTFVPTPKTDIEEVIQERLRNDDTLDDDIFANDVEECTEEDIEMDELENDLCNTEESITSLIPIDLVVENKSKSNNSVNSSVDSEEKVVKKVSSLNEIWRIPEETTVQQTTVPLKPLPEARPAHQQSKTKFLETILSGPPQKCHQEVEKSSTFEQEEPLDLGMSRKSASPTVSSSDTKKVASENLEPALKKMKVEDITLKAILVSKSKETTKTKSSKFKDTNEDQQAVDSTTKSRLLELLTSESALDENKSDPLTQLKEVLSDPELIVPDPLLVPRARLSALVANPAKEIPRLLSQKSEAYSYPKLLTDPDLLVVSLSHLQTLLQSTGKDEDMVRYQQHAQYLQHQLKQEQSPMDAATANALNQMLWLPYLSQLEAAAMACGNNQEFLTMLNLVFPPNGYGQIPYMAPTSPAMNGYDYKNQMEFQQALAMWQEAMLHAASSGQLPNQTVGLNNNNISKPQPETKYNPKQLHQQAARHHETIKQTSARTSPIAMNYQQQRHRPVSHHQYLEGLVNRQAPTPQGTSYRSSHAYQRPRSYNHDYSPYRPSSVQPNLPPPKTEPMRPPSIGSTQDIQKSLKNNTNTCKSLLNILSRPQNSHHVKSVHKPHQPSVDMYKFVNNQYNKQVDTHHVKDISAPPTEKVPGTPVDLSGRKEMEVPKLKVKQHLIDPNSRPKLLKFEDHPEVGSTTGSMPTSGVEETHPHLWHPLFSSQQQKSYSSPWQWTTPVIVNGE